MIEYDIQCPGCGHKNKFTLKSDFDSAPGRFECTECKTELLITTMEYGYMLEIKAYENH